MSSIALINLVSAEKLDAFLKPGGSWETVVAGSVELSFRWAGDIFGTVLPYLEEQGIPLTDPRDEPLSERMETSCFVLTKAHRHLVDQLDPARLDGPALRAYFEAFNETNAEGVERAMLAGIGLLRDVIARVTDDTVGVIVIA